MAKTLLPLLLAPILLGACRSPEGRNAMSEVACCCGTPEGAFDGCACADCVGGEGSSDNPDCACAPVDFEEAN